MSKLTSAEMVNEIAPKFVRFPGWMLCRRRFLAAMRIMEAIDRRNIALRPGHWGIWQSRSVGWFRISRILQWAEDMGAEPLICREYRHLAQVRRCYQYGNGPDLTELGPWIQDAFKK